MIQAVRPSLKMFALVDFDPYGVAIMRTFKYGSQNLRHEKDSAVPRLHWLGIRTRHLLASQRTALQPRWTSPGDGPTQIPADKREFSSPLDWTGG